MYKIDKWEENSIKEILTDLKSMGVDISEYLNLRYDKLDNIHTAYKKGVDASKLYRKGYKGLSASQMDWVLKGLLENINTDIYNKKEVKADIMREVFWVMIEAQHNGLSSAEIDKKGTEALNKLLLREESNKTKPLTKEQQKYIDRMKAVGVDTLALGYEKNTMKPGVLREITLGYEHGVDVSQYYRKGYKLREWQCKEIRLAMEAGVDTKTFNDKDTTPDVMADKRLWLECTTEEQRKFAESVDAKYETNTILRRVISLKEFKDDINLLPIIFKESPSNISYMGKQYLWILRSLLLFDLPYITSKQLSLEKLINDLDNCYSKATAEEHEIFEKARACNDSDKYREILKQARKYTEIKMFEFFRNNTSKNLSELFDLFEKQTPKTENNMYPTHFTEFKNDYLDKETKTMWDKWC